MTPNSTLPEQKAEPAFNEGSLMNTCGDDIDFALDIAAEYLESACETLARLQSAVDSSDAHGIYATAHSLKGSSRAVGGAALAAACQELEQSGQESDLSELARQFDAVKTSYHHLDLAMRSFCGRRAA